MVARGGFTQAMRDLIGDAAEKLDVSNDDARLYPEQNKNSTYKEMAVASPVVAFTPQNVPVTTGTGTFKGPGIKEEPVMENTAQVTAEEISSTTIISKGTVIKGDIISDGDIELCGSLSGNVKTRGSLRVSGGLIGDASAKEMIFLTSEVRGNMSCATEVTIDEASVVYGNVQAESIILNGKIRGNIKVKKGAILQDSAVLWGNLEAGSISIDQGAKLEGEVKIIFDKACKDLFDDKVAVGGTRPAVAATQNAQPAAAPAHTPVSAPVPSTTAPTPAAASATVASTASATAQTPALNALRNSIANASSATPKSPFNV